MNTFNVKPEADNLAQAEVTSASERAVYVKVDAAEKWDSQGLLRLAAVLKGVGETLKAE